MEARLTAVPVSEEAFAAAEPLLERLHQPEAALENLARLAATDEQTLATGSCWAARVELDGVPLLVRSDGDRWSIHPTADGDEAEAMAAARKLHGLLGEQEEGWDLDR